MNHHASPSPSPTELQHVFYAVTDETRRSLDGFIRSHLSVDHESVRSNAAEAAHQARSYAGAILGPNGEIAAGAYGRNDIEDAQAFRAMGLDGAADYIEQRVFILHALAVAPQWRRRGCAATLVRDVLVTIRQGGFTHLIGRVETGTPAVQFYRSCGFTVLPAGAPLHFPESPTPVGLPGGGSYSWVVGQLSDASIPR